MTKKTSIEHKLDPDFKKRWVDALRTGKYKQTRNSLYDQETQGYCCLGIGYKVKFGKEPPIGKMLLTPRLRSIKDKQDLKVLNQSTNTEHGSVESLLIQKNDGDNWSFKKIATWIEKHL